MGRATQDPGAILHFAARHGLSPALRDGSPVLTDGRGGGDRCGWEPFFAALRRAGPALMVDDDDPTGSRPAARADPHPWSVAAAVGAARRFLAAIRSQAEPPG